MSRAESLKLIEGRPPEWRVTRILSTDDYGVLAGPKGVGNTLALIDLSVAVSLGMAVFEHEKAIRQDDAVQRRRRRTGGAFSFGLQSLADLAAVLGRYLDRP